MATTHKSNKNREFSPTYFVEVYADAIKHGWDLQAIANKVGLTPNEVSNKATYMRTIGVHLPYLNKRCRYDADQLNEILKNKLGKRV